MSKTSDNKDGSPDDACDSCEEPIAAQEPIYCKPCFTGEQDDDDEDDDEGPIDGRQCASCGKRSGPPLFCKACMEQSSDTAAMVTAEFAKHNASRSHRPDAATDALETRVALRTIDAQKKATAQMFGPRLPTAKSLRAPTSEAELTVARAAARMRGDQEPTIAPAAPTAKAHQAALDGLRQWNRMTEAQQLADARKTLKAMCTGIAGEDLEASARAFVASRNGALASVPASLSSATLTPKQRATLTELQRDAVAAGVDPARVAEAYRRANASAVAPRPVVKRRAPQDVSGPDLALALAAPRRLGLTERDFYQIEVDRRGEVVSWREFNAAGEFVGMRDPKTKRAVGAA